MNKKFSTLVASLLLAGGAFSSAYAVDFSKVAGDGKYYKILRTAYWGPEGGSNKEWKQDSKGEYFLSQKGLTDAKADFYRIEKTSDGRYRLTSLDGSCFTVKDGENSYDAFYSNEKAISGLTLAGQTRLYLDSNKKKLIGNGEGKSPIWSITIADIDSKKESTDYGHAYSAEETSLQEVPNVFASQLENGKTYRIHYTLPSGMNMLLTDILKASYDKKLDRWSFTYNNSGESVQFDKEVDFELIYSEGNNVVLKLASGKGYVKVENNQFVLVDNLEDATLLAFEATKERVPVTVGILNYYEKDGFSVEITCDKNETGAWDYDELANNPFVGHLTPMTFDWAQIGGNDKEGKFVEAAGVAQEFYLKNSKGEYIVAVKYDVETQLAGEALYGFKTVSEEELIHNLKRAWNGLLNDKQEYFARYRASVDEAALAKDPTKLNEITWLEVNVATFDKVATYEFATVGRADIKKVPTLVASKNTQLKAIKIKLGSGQVANWEDVLQPKFFTVEMFNADGTKSEGKLTASDVFGCEFRKTAPGNELEVQFALTKEEFKVGNATRDYYVFRNRETPTAVIAFIPVNALYTTDKEYTYKYGNNIYVIKPVAEVNEADGYARFSDSELNRQYHVAYSSNVFGAQAYLSENHTDAKDAEFHTIGLNAEKENALVFNIKKYNAARDLKDEQNDHTYNYHPTDSIYVISQLGYYNTVTKAYATKPDTLKIVSYSFVNQFNEPLVGLSLTDAATAEDYAYVSDVYKKGKEKYASVAEAHDGAKKFVVREDKGKYNLRPLNTWKEEFNETQYNNEKTSEDLYQEFSIIRSENGAFTVNHMKMYAGDATDGILSNTYLYERTENDLFVIEETETEVYRRLVKEGLDTISIYRNENEKSLLYEKTTEIAKDQFVNFLGLENIADFTKMEPAMLADTAYVRNETYKPQYMLVVDPTIHPEGKWCEEHQSATCEHAVPVKGWTEGRYLVNLVDSAKAWDEAHKHQAGNPYKNVEGFYKLGFVQATHRNDSLIIASDGKKTFIGNNDNQNGKYAFKYVDTEDKSFVIETTLDGTKTPGYLKWMNGVVVAVDDIKYADVYNMNEDELRNPTANEEVAVSEVSVVAVDGAVVVKGAAGKAVAISNILGQTIANTVIASDNETIAVSAGIVVVAVEGEEAVKAIVK